MLVPLSPNTAVCRDQCNALPRRVFLCCALVQISPDTLLFELVPNSQPGCVLSVSNSSDVTIAFKVPGWLILSYLMLHFDTDHFVWTLALVLVAPLVLYLVQYKIEVVHAVLG